MSTVSRLVWTPELVERFWDGIAATALDNLSFGHINGPRVIELIRPYLQPSGSHLDFGAGGGHLVQRMLEAGIRTAAFEPSAARAEALVSRCRTFPNFLGVVSDDLTEPFDVVLMVEVIEHILEPQLDVALHRVARLTRPGGRLVVTTPNNENLEYASVFCPVSNVLFHPWQHVRSFTPESLEALLAPYGFKRRFMAVVDFSADCEIYEERKRRQAVETPKAAPGNAPYDLRLGKETTILYVADKV